MTWKSHIAIATAITLPFNPTAIGIASLGATAPDWSEWLLNFFGFDVKHRGFTHYLYIPLLIILMSFIFDYKSLIFWFGIGYLSHWIADSLTISGVPISQHSAYRVHFFGGKIRTGDREEYIIAFGLLALSLLITRPMTMISNDNELENKYIIDYKELNNKNIIDNKTYYLNKFKLF